LNGEPVEIFPKVGGEIAIRYFRRDRMKSPAEFNRKFPIKIGVLKLLDYVKSAIFDFPGKTKTGAFVTAATISFQH